MDEKTSIGMNIRKIRIDRGYSQEKLAEFAGLTPVHISHLETGNTMPSVGTLVKIANALNTSTDSLLVDLISEDNTGNSISKELQIILSDCSPSELKMITEIVRTIKNTNKK